MSIEKSPFRDFTIEEIRSAEKDAFVIQVGIEIFTYKEVGIFTKKIAESLYPQIMADLMKLLEKGSLKDKNDARFCLRNMRIMPLRIM